MGRPGRPGPEPDPYADSCGDSVRCPDSYANANAVTIAVSNSISDAHARVRHDRT